MSAKEKHSRESLPEQEAPEEKGFGDRFEAEIGTQSRAFFDKLMEHWPKLAAAVGVFVVLIAGYAGFNAYQDRQLANSEQALSQALLENQGAERLEALMRLRGEMVKPLLPRHHLEAAKAAQDVEDWATALEYWKLVVEVGPDNWKALARMGQATALLHLGQTDEAVAELTSVRAGASEEFLPLVLLQLAEAAEADGNWELALRTFEELQAREDGQQSDYLAFKASQIRQRMAGEST